MLTDLEIIQPPFYVRPNSKNFPTIDAFGVMPQNLFDQNVHTEEFCLVFFQSTISSKHDINGAIIARVEQFMKNKQIKTSGAKYLMFATDEKGITKSQTILNGEGKKYQNGYDATIKQMVLYLGEDFNKLAELYRAGLTGM